MTAPTRSVGAERAAPPSGRAAPPFSGYFPPTLAVAEPPPDEITAIDEGFAGQEKVPAYLPRLALYDSTPISTIVAGPLVS